MAHDQALIDKGVSSDRVDAIREAVRVTVAEIEEGDAWLAMADDDAIEEKINAAVGGSIALSQAELMQIWDEELQRAGYSAEDVMNTVNGEEYRRLEDKYDEAGIDTEQGWWDQTVEAGYSTANAGAGIGIAAAWGVAGEVPLLGDGAHYLWDDDVMDFVGDQLTDSGMSEEAADTVGGISKGAGGIMGAVGSAMLTGPGGKLMKIAANGLKGAKVAKGANLAYHTASATKNVYEGVSGDELASKGKDLSAWDRAVALAGAGGDLGGLGSTLDAASGARAANRAAAPTGLTAWGKTKDKALGVGEHLHDNAKAYDRFAGGTEKGGKVVNGVAAPFSDDGADEKTQALGEGVHAGVDLSGDPALQRGGAAVARGFRSLVR
jgi:hypothetical protein